MIRTSATRITSPLVITELFPIISRIPDCSRYNTVESEALTYLDSQYAKELLFKAVKISPNSRPSYDKQGQDMFDLLGSHTLALIQADAYIAKVTANCTNTPKYTSDSANDNSNSNPVRDSQMSILHSKHPPVFWRVLTAKL